MTSSSRYTALFLFATTTILAVSAARRGSSRIVVGKSLRGITSKGEDDEERYGDLITTGSAWRTRFSGSEEDEEVTSSSSTSPEVHSLTIDTSSTSNPKGQEGDMESPAPSSEGLEESVSPSSSSTSSEEVNSSTECELLVTNDTHSMMMLCWVDREGTLHHMRPVNDRSIKDGSVSNTHKEYTSAGDCFVCLRPPGNSPKKVRDILDEDFIFSYTPLRSSHRHCIEVIEEENKEKDGFVKRKRLSHGTSLRGSSSSSSDYAPSLSSPESSSLPPRFTVTLRCEALSADDKTPINTADKVYDTKLCCGFTVKYEPDVFDCVPGLAETLEEDLSVVCRLLPAGACAALQASSPLWLNKSLTFGTVAKPEVGSTCTFHPIGGRSWLRNNGMNEKKEGCVEIYSAAEYMTSRSHWAVGGVLLHEYSHAFHNVHCPGRFECAEIKEAFTLAMQRGLYECVPVHGSQGVLSDATALLSPPPPSPPRSTADRLSAGLDDGQKGEGEGDKQEEELEVEEQKIMRKCAKAYACANCMEFFAELSVAYHWSEDSSTEFNKWFPFNRSQLQRHDPDSFRVLDKYWSAAM